MDGSTPNARLVAEFVNFALNCTDRSDIAAILARIAELTHCYGAILWEVDPDIPLNDSEARLFTAGQWFRDGKKFSDHTLKVHRSLVGRAILNHGLQTTNDIKDDPFAAKSKVAKAFYDRHAIFACRTAPVQSSDSTVAALALYRQRGDGPFPDDGDDLLEVLSSLLPGIQQALDHSVAFSLIDKVKSLLQAPDIDARPKVALQQVCDAIKTRLHVLEASIFVSDLDLEPAQFNLEATTCPEYAAQKTYLAGQAGLTGRVISRNMPIRIWDLMDFYLPVERALIEREHKGIQWRDSIGARNTAAFLLRIEDPANIPPLSFCAEPILSGNELLGVLRLCTVTEPPYYFTTRERTLLSVVAGQVGQFWKRYLEHKRVIEEENRAWSMLVGAINSLSYSLNSELQKQTPDLMNVLRKGLGATAQLIPGGEIADIRLRDAVKNDLYFALTVGEGWSVETKGERFDLAQKPPQSYGASVFQSGQMEVIDPIVNPKYKLVFPGAKSLMIVPIRSQDKTYGVLDIRTFTSRRFPAHSRQIAQLLGDQFGMYCALVENFGKLREVDKKVKEAADITTVAFADWQHQIRGPVSQSLMRLRDVLRQEYADESMVPLYLKIQRGLLFKAHRATRSLRLFVDLSKGEKLTSRLFRIFASELVKRLIEAGLDNRTLAPTRRGVEFDVKSDTFEVLNSREVWVDHDLVEQAINNVIDNAFKYSYKHTKIEVSGSSEPKWFRLTVSNEGIPILPSEVQSVVKRGWRGERAEGVVGEGSGIGLWVVRHIMEAHGGRIEIAATVDRRTSVHLLFPWKS